MSDSLQPLGLQYTRPPCPSLTPGVHPNPCPFSQWCHPTILSSVVPFSSCPQSCPASGQWVSSLHQVAKVLEFQLHHQSFQWTPRTNLLQDGVAGSPCRIWEAFSFESGFILGKLLLNSIACHRETICEMQGQPLQQTPLLSHQDAGSPTPASSTLASERPATLRQDPLPAMRLQFTGGLGSGWRF